MNMRQVIVGTLSVASVTLLVVWSMNQSKSKDVFEVTSSQESEVAETHVPDSEARVEKSSQETSNNTIRVTLRYPAELLIIDESGNRTGYTAKQVVEEIPETDYEARSEEGVARAIQSIVTSKAVGTYTIKVMGREDGQYTLGILLTRNNDVALYKEITATTSLGRIDTYQIDTKRGEVSSNIPPNITINTERHLLSGENTTCVESDTYVAVATQTDWSQLPRLYVYKRSSLTGGVTCRIHESTPVFTMDLEATYPQYIIGDFLITDSGTGPSGRVLSAYDLTSQKMVLSEQYGSAVDLHSPEVIAYWRPTGTVPTVVNCPNRDEIEKEYLTPTVQEYILRNLVTGTVEHKEQRCVATQ